MINEPFDEKDLDEIGEDYSKLMTMWNAAVMESQEGPRPDAIHPPPGFIVFARALHTQTPFFMNTFGSLPMEMGSIIEQGMISYGHALFRFAQYCAAHGVLLANLSPCKCGSVDDDELKNWLEGNLD